MQHTLVCKLSIQVQRHVSTALVIIISAPIIITLILTQRNVLGILIIVTQRIVLGTQRIVLGILIVIIVTVAVLITVSILNIGRGNTTYGIIVGIITIIGRLAPDTIIIVQGLLGMPPTGVEDTMSLPTTTSNHTALSISSANQWIDTPETTTSVERT